MKKCAYTRLPIILAWKTWRLVSQGLLMRLGWKWWTGMHKKLLHVSTDFSLLSSTYSSSIVRNWLLGLTWTPESIKEWQKFYSNASRRLGFGRSENFVQEPLGELPEYKDLKPPECTRMILSSGAHQKSFMPLVFITFIITFFSY